MPEDLILDTPLECDVVIAGAGLAGLVAGAILSRRGMSVIVVEGARQIGGRAGSAPHRGFWLDGGLRDGRDVGDLQVGWRYGQLAAAEADVEVPLNIVEPRVRIHHVPDASETGAARVTLGSWGANGFIAMARDGFGCPEDRLPDFMKVLASLAGASPSERQAALPERLGDWLDREAPDPELRNVILTMTRVIYCELPEQASVGRLMSFFSRRKDLPDLQTAYANHPTIGGIQGLLTPFAEAIEARGGRILTDLVPFRVLFDGSRATGLVSLDPAQLVVEVHARHTILAHPIWQALELLPAGRIPRSLEKLASKLKEASADAISWQAGLRRVPRVRSTGRVDDHVGWNRVLIGPDKRYNGGFHLPSLGSRASAPDDHHLLHAMVGRWVAGAPEDDWPGMRARVDLIVEHLRDFYLDFDECLIWSAHQYLSSPAFMSWYWAPVRRHEVRAPDSEALYFANTTIESDAGPIDIAAHAGLEAARAILETSGIGPWPSTASASNQP
jgi:glycine/D-amino acid oxidase-like deaminating enzyme